MKAIIILLLCTVLAVPAFVEAQTFTPAKRSPAPAPIRTIRQSLDGISREAERVKNRPTDFPPPSGGGGGEAVPYGRTCKEARERMRWSDMPCSPFMPGE